MKNRVLISDVQSIIREGCRSILASEADFGPSVVVSSTSDAMERVTDQTFDALILGIQPFFHHVVDTVERFRVKCTDVPVLVLGACPARSIGQQVMRAGAAGYVCTQSETCRLVEAVRRVAGGDLFITRETASALSTTLNRDRDAGHWSLSKREFQVLCRIAEGRSRSDIAEGLDISPKTVSTYRCRLLDKLDLASDVELVHYALRHNIVRLLNL